MKRGRRLLCACIAIWAVAAPTAATAQQQWTVPADSLGADGDQHIELPPWTSDHTFAPEMVAGAVGDVNGDTLEDIGAGIADYEFSPDTVHITFSDRTGGLGGGLVPGGFEILVEDLGWGLASAGDVNGDLLGDVAIAERQKTTVVFGKTDGDTVDATNLGTRGFTITEAGSCGAMGGNRVLLNAAVKPVGDLNGDGVGDLLVCRGYSNASVVYPPRNAAGMTIDASIPGPYVTTLTASGDRSLDRSFVDDLGDLDGDGRHELLVGGVQAVGNAQFAWGLRGPTPGQALDLHSEVDAGNAFELQSSGDVRSGVGTAVSLGDQNGDGRREVGLTGHGMGGSHTLRVVYPPDFGQHVEIGDLGATDSRGYSFHSYGSAIDIGDQNGDGRNDFGTYRYAYFTDPALETGDRQPVNSGFYFSFAEPNFATIVGALKDLNADGKPELIVARGTAHENSDDPSQYSGESATYTVDVFDSALVPDIPLPDPPVELPDGTVEVPIDIGTGAGSGSGASLGLHPVLELDGPGEPASVVADGGLMPSGGETAHLALKFQQAKLAPGQQYRVRYSAGNGRGLAAEGPWRTFGFASSKEEPKPKPPTGQPKPPTGQPEPPTGRPACAAGKRTVRGTRRRDTLTGSVCADRLLGFGGNDSLNGRRAADVVDGGTGRDRLIGGAGRDVLRGGSGADRLDARDGERDTVFCGSGRDLVRADRIDKLRGCERRQRR